MVDDLEERLSRYRADLDAAVAADLARRHREAGFDDADPLLLDIDHAIQLEPTMSTRSDRRRVVLVATLGVAAAVATLVLVGVVVSGDGDSTPADQPSSTVTVSPTTPPGPLPLTFGRLTPGTYFVDEVAGIPTPRILATLGAGWGGGSNGWHIAKRDDNRTLEEMARDANKTVEEMPADAYLQHDVGVMEFSHPIAVYSDACHWEAGNHSGPLDTVDGLVTALREQQGWAEVTAASDISVDGYVGKAFQRTAPADMSECSTRNYGMRTGEPGVNSDFRSWKNPDDGAGWAGFYYEPGWIETLWVLDLDGTMVVISTGVWPEPSAGADADFAADVLGSIRIERP